MSWDEVKPPPALVTPKHGASIVGTTLIEDDQTLLLIDDENLRVLPVIMHSSLGGNANLDKGRAAGCDDYVVKFEPVDLLQVVEKYLGNQY